MKLELPEDFCKTGAVRPVAYVREAIAGEVRIFDCRLDADELERLSDWAIRASKWCRESLSEVQSKSEKKSLSDLKKAFPRSR